MCGIAGIFNLDGAPVQIEILRGMGEIMAHRGPDDSGLFAQGSVGLAHRRLSIIDLSPLGHQPMWTVDGRFGITYNGEVYNYVELKKELAQLGHTFQSNSDTEVILEAYREWGEKCVTHFNGMFAFAIWDRVNRNLFLARDRLGVKPLYYFYNGLVFLFASEIKALLQHPGLWARPNRTAIREYVDYSFTLGSATWFEGVKQLLPGHYMLVDADGVREVEYWDVRVEAEGAGPPDETQLVEQLRDLLADAVRLRLRSDVPLGCHLSGGLDSSAVVAFASQELGTAVKTFNGRFAEGLYYDESSYARLVAGRFKTDHQEVLIRYEDLAELITRLVWFMDEPAVGPGIVPQYLVAKLAKAHVQVVLGGQGGDELFAGYHKYMPIAARSMVRQLAAGRVNIVDALSFAGNLTLFLFSERRRLAGYLQRRRRPTGRVSDDAFTPNFRRLTAHAEPVATGPRRNELDQALYLDVKQHLRALLQVEDRTSMAVSLESRVPLLDYRIVELAFRIPSELKLKRGVTKYVLRRAVQGLLPEEVVGRRDKRGFPTPTREWFRGPLRSWLEGRLLSDSFAQRDIFAPDYVKRIVVEHMVGRADHSQLLWKMLNIELWFRCFVDGEPCGGRTDA